MAQSRRTRILIVDDSAVMRSLLRTIICSDPALEVAGTAADGVAALRAVESIVPDIVLLDVETPGLEGLDILRTLRAHSERAPLLMVSAVTHRDAHLTIDALAYAASDYEAKLGNAADRETCLRVFAPELLSKIHALRASPPGSLPRRVLTIDPISPPCSKPPAVVVIGVSTGGPAALDVLLPAIPEGFPLPILVVQHMPELFTGQLADRLSERCPMRVVEAIEGAPVLKGNIQLARGNWHMEMVMSARTGSPPTLHLHQGPLESHCRPAVDVLFRSAAAVYGGGTLAVILTGMGSDGLASCRILRAQGATVLAQDEASSAVWGMPGAVVQAGLANRVLPLAAIAPEILRMATRTTGEARPAAALAGQR